MKKSLLALGAAAALGGLGFSGAAHAVWAVGPVSGATATQLSTGDNSGVGHILVTPYFSTTNGTGTLLSVVNTDTKNGKAVKVRFRGAANSDDILDFTVLLSPGDVWSASVSQSANGTSQLVSPDTTCVLPALPTASAPAPFNTTRLDQTLSADALAAHTQEGYVEWLNMADIPEGSPVYKAIKHVKNADGEMVAPCTAAVMNDLMRASGTTEVAASSNLSTAQASAFGLVNPTGGLMGNWTIFNSTNVTSYGGSNTAIMAQDGDGNSAAGRLFFAPQIGANDPTFPSTVAEWTAGVGVNHLSETADPLLTNTAGGGIEAITMLPFDLPDLSTPYVSTATTAVAQADDLSGALAATAVINEWTAAESNGVDFSTDWVFSQPTRRYHAVINYTAAEGTDKDVYNMLSDEGPTFYQKTRMEVQTHATYGDMLCLKTGEVGYLAFNREEGSLAPTFGGGEWSPGTPPGQQPGFCGEVAVLQFGSDRARALNGQLTPETINDESLPGGAGWLSVNIKSPNGLPVIGYSANTFSTAVGNNIGNYGDAVTHRYNRPVVTTP